MGDLVFHSSCVFTPYLQPENIMLSEKAVLHPNIKIIDFGLAHHFEQGEEYKSISGTPQYIGEWYTPHFSHFYTKEVHGLSWRCVEGCGSGQEVVQ